MITTTCLLQGLLLLLLHSTGRVSARVTCDQCSVIAADISAFAANNTDIERLVHLLETEFCDVQYKTKPLKKLACDEVAKGLGALVKLAYKQISTLAWDSINLCAVAGLCKVKCCDTDTVPEQLHLALTKMPTTMSVGWTTLNDTTTHIVQYGLSPDALNTTSAAGAGASRTYDHFGWVGHLHNAVMENLSPNGTKYYYRVGDGTGGWSKVWSFRTLYTDSGSDAHPLVVASVGDMGYGPNSDPTVARIASLVDDDKIDLVIHNGDISYADGEYVHWDVFMRKVETIAARVPYQVSPGNHELWFNFSAYKLRFFMPDNGTNDGLYHNCVVGAGVHLIGMDTESWWDRAYMNQRQIGFIQHELESSPGDSWRIAFGHRPLYASNHGGADIPAGYYYLRGKIEDTLGKYDVDVVLQAHEHDYERSWPVARNGTVWETDYVSPSHPVYVVNGAAGNREAEPTPPGKMPWQPQDQNFTNLISFGRLTVKGKMMTWEQIVSTDGSVQDSFTITK